MAGEAAERRGRQIRVLDSPRDRACVRVTPEP
jgi:hypothetical protein